MEIRLAARSMAQPAFFSPLLFVCHDDVFDGLTLGVLAGLIGGQCLAVGRDHNPGVNGRLASYLAQGFKRSPVDTLDGRGRVRRQSTCDRIVLAVKLSDVFGVDWLALRSGSVDGGLEAA